MPNAHNLTDREAAIDAIIRFCNSLDSGDPTLCASSLTPNTTLDLTPFSASGQNFTITTGRTAVVDLLLSALGPLDTTHCATNIRCTVDGDTAELTCCVLAQHFRGGEGPKPEFGDYWFCGNQYVARIVRDGDEWRVERLVITPAWTVGKPEVMKV